MYRMDQAEDLRNIIKKKNYNIVRNSRIIAVTSGKGGVGKSCTSVNIALQFKKLGKKVIILDTDFGMANVEVMFGVIPKFTLGDLLFSDKSIRDIISEGPDGVGFISGGSGIVKMGELDKLQIKRLVNKMSELEEMADVIIIDTGAGMASSVMEFLLASPEIILVTTPEPASITDSYALLKALNVSEDFDKSRCSVKLLANKVNNEKEGNSLYEKLDSVVKKFLDIDLGYIGAVPNDKNVGKAIMKQTPVSLMYPQSDAALAYKKAVGLLCISKNDDNNNVQHRGIKEYFKTIFTKKRKME